LGLKSVSVLVVNHFGELSDPEPLCDKLFISEQITAAAAVSSAAARCSNWYRVRTISGARPSSTNNAFPSTI